MERFSEATGCTTLNAAQAREGLLQFETEQLRARLSEIDELLRNGRLLLDQARDKVVKAIDDSVAVEGDPKHVGDYFSKMNPDDFEGKPKKDAPKPPNPQE